MPLQLPRVKLYDAVKLFHGREEEAQVHMCVCAGVVRTRLLNAPCSSYPTVDLNFLQDNMETVSFCQHSGFHRRRWCVRLTADIHVRPRC